MGRIDEPEPTLPPGPYRVEWPAEQGGSFTLWGRQGTPPDFKDGWAIPLVASGVDVAMYAICDMLNAGTLDEAWSAAEAALPQRTDGGGAWGSSGGVGLSLTRLNARAYAAEWGHFRVIEDTPAAALLALATALRAVPA